MSWLVCHIVSGDAFISGLLCVAAGLALIWLRRTKRGQIGGRLLLIGGWILAAAALSVRDTQPVVMAFVFSIWALVASVLPERISRPDRVPGGTDFVRPGSLIGISLVTVSLIQTLFQEETIDAWKSNEPIHIIGDSLSAGIDAGEGEPWPEKLAAILDSEVVSHAEAGVTAKSAIDRLSSFRRTRSSSSRSEATICSAAERRRSLNRTSTSYSRKSAATVGEPSCSSCRCRRSISALELLSRSLPGNTA